MPDHLPQHNLSDGGARTSVESPLLEIKRVSYQFGGVVAADDVTLNVGSGRIVGLIGPNGAGKTTLINLITGHLRPRTGTAVRLEEGEAGVITGQGELQVTPPGSTAKASPDRILIGALILGFMVALVFPFAAPNDYLVHVGVVALLFAGWAAAWDLLGVGSD